MFFLALFILAGSGGIIAQLVILNNKLDRVIALLENAAKDPHCCS